MTGEKVSSYPPRLTEQEIANAHLRAEEMRELITDRSDPLQLQENILNLFSAIELGIIPWDIGIRVLHGLSHVSFDDI